MNWLIVLACISSINCHTISTEVPLEKRWISSWITEWLRPTTSTSPPTVLPSHDPPKDCPPCQCGIARTRRRIVGGHETKKLEFPWMAVLLYGGRFYCGGSLINDLYVLTAAHCTAGFQANKITVRFLEHDRSMANETRIIDRKVQYIIRHALYNPASYDSDIALLKLNERVDLSSALKRIRRRKEGSGDNGDENDGDNGGENGSGENGGDESEDDVGLRPVCLASPQLSYANYSSVVTGWGTTQEGGAVSNTLQEVYVPILTNDYCNSSTAYKRRITANMLCAGEMEGGRDACQGDSGGPLHVLNPDTAQFQEVGIVSWGEGCARPNRPGVYTRVNRYLSWIKGNTRDACYCP